MRSDAADRTEDERKGQGGDLGRDTFAAEVRRFIADVVEQAGGAEAVARGLQELGFEGQNGAFEERTVRSWRSGGRMPNPDVVFALANKFGVSLDRYAFGVALGEHLEEMRRRLEVLGAGAA